MYLLKTKGTAKISDYIQIRYDAFILIDHFIADNHEKVSGYAKDSRSSVRDKSVDKLSEIINKLPYGILKKIDL